ncbi:LysR family transcriptional regulator [Lacrimispora saccharolytica]|nr:LysR family transcriptional regulator [Lacrimispora saccharolytica]
MELRQLQCMVICAQTKSFSRAASMLFTSQSNVSKTIASLENELGKKIFERKRHGIELTAKGKQIYQYALSMVECSAKILDCAEEDATEELRVSFQPSSWFANAFCEYYIQESAGEKYNIISAPAEETIRRIIASQDQLGFAYFEDVQLEKHENRNEICLVQGIEDYYSGISLWKEQKEKEEEKYSLQVKVTTNSDYIMQAMLQKTDLGNISPNCLSHSENSISHDTMQLENQEQSVQFVCLFRNDQKMEKLSKKFLTFIKDYIGE